MRLGVTMPIEDAMSGPATRPVGADRGSVRRRHGAVRRGRRARGDVVARRDRGVDRTDPTRLRDHRQLHQDADPDGDGVRHPLVARSGPSGRRRRRVESDRRRSLARARIRLALSADEGVRRGTQALSRRRQGGLRRRPRGRSRFPSGDRSGATGADLVGSDESTDAPARRRHGRRGLPDMVPTRRDRRQAGRGARRRACRGSGSVRHRSHLFVLGLLGPARRPGHRPPATCGVELRDGADPRRSVRRGVPEPGGGDRCVERG